jgi:hypothetical protein
MSENAKHCLQGLTVHSVTHQIVNHANSMVFDIEHKIILVRKALLEDDVPHCMLHFCECFLPDVAQYRILVGGKVSTSSAFAKILLIYRVFPHPVDSAQCAVIGDSNLMRAISDFY